MLSKIFKSKLLKNAIILTVILLIVFSLFFYSLEWLSAKVVLPILFVVFYIKEFFFNEWKPFWNQALFTVVFEIVLLAGPYLIINAFFEMPWFVWSVGYTVLLVSAAYTSKYRKNQRLSELK